MLKNKYSCYNQWLDFISQKVTFRAETPKFSSSKLPNRETSFWSQTTTDLKWIWKSRYRVGKEQKLNGETFVYLWWWCFVSSQWTLPPMLFYNNPNWLGRNAAAMNEGQTVGSMVAKQYNAVFSEGSLQKQQLSKITELDGRIEQTGGGGVGWGG